MKRFLFCCSLFIIHCSLASWADVRVELSAAQEQIVEGDTLDLSVKIFTSEGDTITQAVDMSSLPGLESFSLINSAQSSHSRMVIINGDRSSESGVRFDLEFLTPGPGEYHIGPIVIDSSQGAIQSNTLSVSVRERFVASKVSGGSDTWRWWLLGVAALVIFGYIINACKKLILGKKTRPLMVYSRDEVQERIQSCQEVDGLFFLLQDLLAHVHGDRVRSKTHDELKSLQDSRALSDLLEAFKTNRYAKSQVALENVRETFLSYLDDYDGFESNDSNN